jgi:hypothetical protein
MSSNWINRMNDLEVTPPEKGWEKVAAALDESLNGLQFPAKLYEEQVTPPAAVWNAIETRLDAATAPVIPLKKRSFYPVWVRYAAAACIVGLIAFAAFRFMGKKPVNTNETVMTNTAVPQAPETNSEAPATNEPDVPAPQTAITQSDEEALEQSKQTFAKLDLPKRTTYSKLYKSPAQLASFISTDGEPAKTPEIQYSHRAAVSDSPAEDADRYVMYRDTDGRFIRISKKLSDLFCCVSGEVQDEKCNTQLKQWREKIASSPFNPSPDNFMDILDLINSIQDNRN